MQIDVQRKHNLVLIMIDGELIGEIAEQKRHFALPQQYQVKCAEMNHFMIRTTILAAVQWLVAGMDLDEENLARQVAHELWESPLPED